MMKEKLKENEGSAEKMMKEKNKMKKMRRK